MKAVYPNSYENFKVYLVSFRMKSDVESLNFWIENPMIDFWSLPAVNKSATILVGPSMHSQFEEFLSSENFNYEILIENVGRLK